MCTSPLGTSSGKYIRISWHQGYEDMRIDNMGTFSGWTNYYPSSVLWIDSQIWCLIRFVEALKLHKMQDARILCRYHLHRPPHSCPHPHRPPPHQPSHHHYSRRQEVLAGTERWIRLHDLIIKGELAPDVSSNKIRFDKCCMNIYVDDDIPDGWWWHIYDTNASRPEA